jgi:hypothetical protein
VLQPASIIAGEASENATSNSKSFFVMIVTFREWVRRLRARTVAVSPASFRRGSDRPPILV